MPSNCFNTEGRLQVGYLSEELHDLCGLRGCDLCAIYSERARGQRLDCVDFCKDHLGQNAYFFRDTEEEKSRLRQYLKLKKRQLYDKL